MEPYTVPEHTYEALLRWVEEKLPTGGFLEAVLDNDLLRALSYGDPENLAALPEMVTLINSISGVPKFYKGAMREWVNEPVTYPVTMP